MKQRIVWALLISTVMLAAAPIVFAFNGPPVADTWTDSSSTVYGSASTFKLVSDNTGGCVATSTAYIKWDISSIASEPVSDKTIATAILSLTVDSAYGQDSFTISLYQAGNDTWTEAGTSGASQPGITGSALSTALIDPGSASAGTVISFLRTSELASYLNSVSVANQSPGNGLASFAMQITSCPSGQPRVDFRSLQYGTASSRPVLDLSNPTAVTLSTFRAADPAPNWTLIGIVAILAAFAVSGALGVARRRERGR